jgi:2-dehydropantoate 2-reductase
VTAVCAEAAAVMAAEGVLVGEAETACAARLEAFTVETARRNAANYSSMYQDVAAGRPTEIEYINGYVLRQGRAHGLALPANEMLYGMIKLREAAAAAKAQL